MSEPWTDKWTSEDGSVVMYCGDCLKIIPNMPPCLGVSAVVTDPPFGIDFASRPTKWQRRAGMEAQDWDATRPTVSDLLKIAPIVVIWGGNYFGLPVSRGWLVWSKPDAPPSMGKAELAWTNLDQNTQHISHSIAATNPERVGHPTQKPERVMRWTLETAKVPQSGLVLDPFMGSGTTGVACIRTGRKFIGIEISPEYFAIAKARIQRELDIKKRCPMLPGIEAVTP